MAQPAAGEQLSVEAYLHHEDGAPFRSEYVNGRLFGRVGASDAHNLIAGNIFGLLWTATRGSGCRAYQAGVLVRALDRVFYYPDVAVVCESAGDETYFKRSPCLMVEVLSPSTAAVDRGEKLHNSTQIPALQAYVLVSQEVRRLEVDRRTDAGKWTYEALEPLDALALACPEVTLPLADIYENVPLRPADEPLAPPRLGDPPTGR